MESFFRYVSYVDYYKKSEKIKNVGFLRWKLHSGEHRLELQVKNLYGIQGIFEIKEKNTGKVIGNLCVDQGIGNFSKKFSSKTASGSVYIDTVTDRLYLDEVEGFVVWLREGEYLAVDLKLEHERKQNKIVEDYGLKEEVQKENKKEANNSKGEYELSQKERGRIEQNNLLNQKAGRRIEENLLNQKENRRIEEEKRGFGDEDLLYEEGDRERIRKDILLSSKGKEFGIEQEKLSNQKEDRRIEEEKLEVSYEKGDNIKYEEKTLVFGKNRKKIEEAEAASENILIEGISDKYIERDYLKEKEISERQNKKIKIIEPIHEDKWQELCKKYQHVHPFPSNKVFLSIKPEDFIVLQQKYQKLVNNSFLLHGFYNYGHMILGKLGEEDKAPVYIGVPGVYYEREKQAAQMFGFAGFESTEHPVQAGSYGYYMIEVEI